jgi:hypothetical protein
VSGSASRSARTVRRKSLSKVCFSSRARPRTRAAKSDSTHARASFLALVGRPTRQRDRINLAEVETVPGVGASTCAAAGAPLPSSRLRGCGPGRGTYGLRRDRTHPRGGRARRRIPGPAHSSKASRTVL